MKMSMSAGMRMEQRMKLAPRMIQSMEVLQLPLLALQEKIEAELNSNPVLEQVEPTVEDGAEAISQNESEPTENFDERELVVKDDSNNVEDFQRLDNIGYDEDGIGDYMDRGSYQAKRGSGDPDKKLEAIANTAALERSLNDLLIDQWRLIEADDLVKEAGDQIINYIDEKGYLTVRVEQLHNKDKHKFTVEHLYKALELIQRLEPAGVGARDVQDCLLIQMSQFPENMSFEIRLVSDHWEELLENRLPQIAKKMKCSLDQLNDAIAHMSKLDTSPGLLVGRSNNYPITADVIVEPNEDNTGYIVQLADARIPSLRVNDFYSVMSKDRKIDTKTREFLQQNIRSAQWLMDAIEQRKSTLLKVASSVVKHQVEFFDKGRLFLKPLPMATVADEVGVHIATVSRAVAAKYIQCAAGVLPLRGFFSGGMESDDGQQQSWDAVREKMKMIIDAENKSKPLNDDDIRLKLEEMGAGKIARRTVAKYRKLMNIPTARFRKKY